MQAIHECLEYIFDTSLSRVDAYLVTLENARDFDSVTGLANVNKFVVGAYAHGVGCLPIRHRIGSLLELDNLFVRES
jgi:hypothetical protein